MESVSAEAHPRRFVVLGLLGTGNILSYLIVLSLGILLPSISDDLDLSPTEQGWLGSSFFLANLVFAVPLSIWLSKFNANIVVSLTFLSGAAFTLLQGWTDVYLLLLLGRVLFGISIISREPARALLMAQWVPSREMVMANSFLNATLWMSDVLAFALTPFVLALLDDSWRGTFTVYAILYFVLSLAWMALGSERKTASYRGWVGHTTRVSLRSVLRHKDLVYLVIGMLGSNVTWISLMTFWPTLMLEKYDIPLTTSGILQGSSWFAAGGGGVLVAAYLMKKNIRKQLLVVSAVAQALTALGMVHTGSVPLLAALNILYGLAWAFYPIAMTLPFQLPDIKPQEIAVAVVLIELDIWAGGSIGPVLAGLLQDATGDLTFALMITSFFSLSLIVGGLLISGHRSEAAVAPSAGSNP